MKTLIAVACSTLALCACAVDYPNAPVPVHAVSSPQPKMLSMGQWNGEAEVAAHDFAVALRDKPEARAPFCVGLENRDGQSAFAHSYARFFVAALANEGVQVAAGGHCMNKVVLSVGAVSMGSWHGVIAPYEAQVLPSGKMLDGNIPNDEVAVIATALHGPKVVTAQTTVYYFAPEDAAYYAPPVQPPAPAPEPGRTFAVRSN